MEWTSWCRLCGKEEGNQIHIFIKKENFSNIAETIRRFFAIEINNYDEIPKHICTVCNEFLISLLIFTDRANKVEDMFLEIGSNLKIGTKIDLNEIRVKYNVDIPSFIQPNLFLSTEIENAFVEKQEENDVDLTNTLEDDESKKFDDSAVASVPTSEQDSIKNNKTSEKSELAEKKNLKVSIIKNDPLICEDSSNSLDLDDQDNLPNSTSDEDDKTLATIVKQEISDSDKTTFKKIKRKKKRTKYNDEEKSFECEECHMKFVRESNYAFHLRKMHNIIKQLPPCKFCGKICKTKQKLKFHLELHLPPEEREKLLFKCPHCEQKFTQKGAMRSHVRAQHSFEKPFVCEQCGKNFASQTNLWSHRRSHDDKNHLSCSLCPKIFKNKFRLRVHMRGHSESCHPCSVCGLVLKTMNTLKNHMLVHSDEKPFKCNFCGKDFKRDKNLQNHMITHSGLRPFICRFCGQSYANRSNCKKHEKHSHPAEYEVAATVTNSEPQQRVVKKLPNIQQLEAILEQIKSEKEGPVNSST